MAYCYADKNLKDIPDMKRFRIKTRDGKERIATLSRKTKLLTVKEIEERIKEIDERLAMNEAKFAKKEITGMTYDNTRNLATRDRQTLEHDLGVMRNLVYVGESIEFMGYVPTPQ